MKPRRSRRALVDRCALSSISQLKKKRDRLFARHAAPAWSLTARSVSWPHPGGQVSQGGFLCDGPRGGGPVLGVGLGVEQERCTLDDGVERDVARIVLISGAKGEGKTSFVLSYTAKATREGRSVGGVAAPAVFENGERRGYDLINLHTGTRRIFARLSTRGETGPVVGPYRVDEAAIVEGREAIISAVRRGFHVIAIDEVGPLEFSGGGWAPAFEAALRELGADQELVVAVRPSLAEELPHRFPSEHWSSTTRISPPPPNLESRGG